MASLPRLLCGAAVAASLLPAAAMAEVSFTRSDRFSTVFCRDPRQMPLAFCNGTGRVPVIAGRSNTLTIFGDWLDITNVARLTGAGPGRSLPFTTGKGPDGKDPFVKVVLPGNLPLGNALIRLSRLGGQDTLRVRVVPDVQISAVRVLSAETRNLAYENAFKRGNVFLIRMQGSGLNRVRLSMDSLGLTQQGDATTLQSGEVELRVSSASTVDLREILERDLIVRYPEVQELRYNELRTHPFNSSPFNFFRIYDKPSFRLAEVQNRFDRAGGSACPSLRNPADQQPVENAPMPDGAALISRYGLANPTAATPQTTKELQWPAIRLTIRNTSYAPVPAFQAQVKFGENIVDTVTVPRMIAQGSAVISFRRVMDSRKLLGRHVSCPGVYELMAAPFNWVDPAYTLVLDPSGTTELPEPVLFQF